jgi:hypothetical protein
MGPTPEIGHDGRNAVGEQTEQIFQETSRQERHVTSGDEDGPVSGGEKTGLDAGERPLAAGTQVGDTAGFRGGVSSPPDD